MLDSTGSFIFDAKETQEWQHAVNDLEVVLEAVVVEVAVAAVAVVERKAVAALKEEVGQKVGAVALKVAA